MSRFKCQDNVTSRAIIELVDALEVLSLLTACHDLLSKSLQPAIWSQSAEGGTIGLLSFINTGDLRVNNCLSNKHTTSFPRMTNGRFTQFDPAIFYMTTPTSQHYSLFQFAPQDSQQATANRYQQQWLTAIGE